MVPLVHLVPQKDITTECLQQCMGVLGPYRKIKMIYKKYTYYREQAESLSSVTTLIDRIYKI